MGREERGARKGGRAPTHPLRGHPPPQSGRGKVAARCLRAVQSAGGEFGRPAKGRPSARRAPRTACARGRVRQWPARSQAAGGRARRLRVKHKCGRRDLNPHGLRHWNLNPACLPFHHARMLGHPVTGAPRTQQMRQPAPAVESPRSSVAPPLCQARLQPTGRRMTSRWETQRNGSPTTSMSSRASTTSSPASAAKPKTVRSGRQCISMCGGLSAAR